MVLQLMRALVISVVGCKLQPQFRIYVWYSPKSEILPSAPNTSRKHGEEAESANVFVDHSKRRTTGRACFSNQGRVHIWCLFFFFWFFLVYAHTTGATALNLFPLIFFFDEKWWLEISKRCMMGNNFKTQEIVVLLSLLLRSLIKSLDVRRCQMTVSVSEFYQSLPVLGRLAHFSKYSSDQLSARGILEGRHTMRLKQASVQGGPRVSQSPLEVS